MTSSRFRRLAAALAACAGVVVAGASPAAAAPVAGTDPLFGRQWGPQVVQAPKAWGLAPPRTSPVVAVLDTGVDASHPDLTGSVLRGRSFVADGATGDPHGHGTAVAGVIAARAGNGVGVAGYCPTCRILPVRVLDRNAGGSASVVADGIRWAVDNGATVINLALVMLGRSDRLESAVAYARDKGVPVVAAAGNGGGTTPTYPAALDDAIGVVGTDATDAPYPWADRGRWADVAAPGCAFTTQLAGGFAESCGSSIAAPAVAGIIGHALAVFPTAGVDDIDAALAASSKPLGNTARIGRIDAAGLLVALRARLQPAAAAKRVAGTNRVETAVALSRLVHPSATDVVIATGDAYADALSASALAGHVGGPVLLARGGTLPPVVVEEIRRLGAGSAWVVGGTGAVADAALAQLRALGVNDVRRLAGPTRFETAAAIARAVGSDRVIVTDASSWSDASAASALSAARGRPILFVDGPTVPAATLTALRELAVVDVAAVGDPSVLADAALTAIRSTGASVRRIEGATALATASMGGETRAARLWLATGANWPDALAAGPAASASGAVLLVVDAADRADMDATVEWLDLHADDDTSFVVVGGEASLPSSSTTWLTAAALSS